VVTASSVHNPESGGGKSGGKSATVGDLSGLGVDLRANPKGPTMIDGAIQYHGGKVYKDSKLCNLLFLAEAARRYASPVRVVSFNPGFVPTTGLFASMRDKNPWKATTMVWIAKCMGWSVPLEVAGERLVHMILDPNIPTGSYYSAPVGSRATDPETGFGPSAVSKEASDAKLARKLWIKSIEVTKL
jgi:protochlorophyllide reductase